MNNENLTILERLEQVSNNIIIKEQRYASKYNLEAPKEVKNKIFKDMLEVKKKVTEYKFISNMKDSIFEKVVPFITVDDIWFSINTLICDVEENYYCDIAKSVVSFLGELSKEFDKPCFELLSVDMKFYIYQLKIETKRNICIKEHPEYSKIEELIKCRENIIRFFHNKGNLDDYLLEELEELNDLLLAYESHMLDIKDIEDCKLKSIIFQDFYPNYASKLKILFDINDV